MITSRIFFLINFLAVNIFSQYIFAAMESLSDKEMENVIGNSGYFYIKKNLQNSRHIMLNIDNASIFGGISNNMNMYRERINHVRYTLKKNKANDLNLLKNYRSRELKKESRLYENNFESLINYEINKNLNGISYKNFSLTFTLSNKSLNDLKKLIGINNDNFSLFNNYDLYGGKYFEIEAIALPGHFDIHFLSSNSGIDFNGDKKLEIPPNIYYIEAKLHKLKFDIYISPKISFVLPNNDIDVTNQNVLGTLSLLGVNIRIFPQQNFTIYIYNNK